MRFINNKYNLKTIDINKDIKKIYEQIEINEARSLEKYPPNMKKSIDSLGNKKTKTTFYTGTGGNIYIYWKQYLFYDKKKEYLDKFYQSLKTNYSIMEKMNEGDEKTTNSFFMGDSGIYLFYCIYASEINSDTKVDPNVLKKAKEELSRRTVEASYASEEALLRFFRPKLSKFNLDLLALLLKLNALEPENSKDKGNFIFRVKDFNFYDSYLTAMKEVPITMDDIDYGLELGSVYSNGIKRQGN